jgi:hypothetical protein
MSQANLNSIVNFTHDPANPLFNDFSSMSKLHGLYLNQMATNLTGTAVPSSIYKLSALNALYSSFLLALIVLSDN